MHVLVKLLLDAIVRWLHAHPDSALSRHMLKDRGPRTDTKRMTRLDRLKSGLSYLAWGMLFAAIWALICYLAFGDKTTRGQVNPLVLGLFFAAFFAAAICLLAGLYLLIRVIA